MVAEVVDYKTGHKKYLESNSWRCPDAPIDPTVELQAINNTGAHHWIHLDGTPKIAESRHFQCKYCRDVKKF